MTAKLAASSDMLDAHTEGHDPQRVSWQTLVYYQKIIILYEDPWKHVIDIDNQERMKPPIDIPTSARALAMVGFRDAMMDACALPAA